MAPDATPRRRNDRRSDAILVGFVVAVSVAVAAFVFLSRAADEQDLTSRLRETGWEGQRVDVHGLYGPYPLGQREELDVTISGDYGDARRLCDLLTKSDTLGARQYDSRVHYGDDRGAWVDC